MEDDPFIAYVGLAENLLDRTLRNASRVDDPESMEIIAEESFFEVEGDLFELAEKSWEDRKKIEVHIGECDRIAFRSLDSMIGMFRANYLLLSKDDSTGTRRPPDVVRYVISALSVKATSVAHEICAMLRAGFPAGARARWRTLYEVDIIAHVISRGNRGTAARFVNHRWVQMARDVHRSPGSWSEPGPSPNAMKNRFIRRYGKTFGGTYGWAAELTKRKLGVDKPNLGDLEKIARLDGHRSRVHSSHHGVHADSLGMLQLVGESGLFHPGATIHAASNGCLETTRVLGEIMDALLATWSNYSDSPRIDALRYLNDEMSLILQRDISSSHFSSQGNPATGEPAPID